jgi:hypothetical protein
MREQHPDLLNVTVDEAVKFYIRHDETVGSEKEYAMKTGESGIRRSPRARDERLSKMQRPGELTGLETYAWTWHNMFGRCPASLWVYWWFWTCKLHLCLVSEK